MLLLDELRLELEGYRKDMADLYNILNIDKLKEDNAKLQEQSAADGFWDDLENSQKVMQTIKQNEATIENYKKLNEMLEDTLTMIELTVEEGKDEDETTVAELKAEAEKFKAFGSKSRFLQKLPCRSVLHLFKKLHSTAAV